MISFLENFLIVGWIVSLYLTNQDPFSPTFANIFLVNSGAMLLLSLQRFFKAFKRKPLAALEDQDSEWEGFRLQKQDWLDMLGEDFTSELSERLWLVIDMSKKRPQMEVFASEVWANTIVEGFEDSRIIVKLSDYLGSISSAIEEKF